jgi:hypothetical protein
MKRNAHGDAGWEQFRPQLEMRPCCMGGLTTGYFRPTIPVNPVAPAMRLAGLNQPPIFG